MMKKKVSMAMAAVMAVTLMVAAVPAEVNANGLDESTKTGEITVSYTNESVLADPDYPEVIVKIPASIAFTDDEKKIDATVTLESTDTANQPLTTQSYPRTATVSVASENAYQLKYAGASLGYQLIYGNAMTENTDSQQIGVMGSVEGAMVTQIGGEAKLGDDIPTQIGKYTDTLTYSVVFEDAE